MAAPAPASAKTEVPPPMVLMQIAFGKAATQASLSRPASKSPII